MTEKISINKDEYRPVYHPIAEMGWMNDPNGLIFHDGYYHIFYQWNPNDSIWDTINWGHMRTKDFQNYEYMPIALKPDAAYDKDGCFSGTAILDDEGNINLFYTANIFQKDKHPLNDGPITQQSQCVAVLNEDMFVKDIRNPVLEMDLHERTDVDFRDPKVRRESNEWAMYLGSRIGLRGEILKYVSSDLRSWKFDKQVLMANEEFGYVWECPDVFSIEGHEVLLFSPMGVEKYNDNHVSGYIVKGAEYDLEEFKILDHGPNFYAPQTFANCNDSVLIGWINMPTMNPKFHEWQGCLTLPRKLENSDYGIKSRIYKMENLKKNLSFELANQSISTNETVTLYGDQNELKINFLTAPNQNLEILFKTSNDGCSYGKLIIDLEERLISIDLSNLVVEVPNDKNGFRYYIDENLDVSSIDITIYFDKSVIEIYALDGLYTATLSLLSRPSDQKIILKSSHDYHISELEFYDIESVKYYSQD